MKFCIAFLACIAISYFSFSQSIPKNPNITDSKGLRQGKWTLMFDANWNPVTDYSKGYYYRVIAYKNDKPIGIVRDYYADGKIQWEGELLADKPQEINHGTATWYRPDGSKEMEKEFTEGVMTSVKYFNMDGSLADESWLQLNEKGTTAYNAGDYKLTEQFWSQALVQAEKEFGPNNINYGTALYNMGTVSYLNGQYQKAEQLYTQCKEVWGKILGRDHPYYATILNNYGLLLSKMGQYQRAEQMYLESKDVREKIFGRESADYAVSISNLAVLYQDGRQYKKAEPLLLECARIQEKIIGKENSGYAITMNNLGLVYDNMGQYQSAEIYYLQAKEILEKAAERNNHFYATVLSNLGTVYRRMGNKNKALECLHKSKSIREQALGKQHPHYSVSLGELGRLYFEMGDHTQAANFFKESNALLLNEINRIFPSLSESEREFFYSTVQLRFESINALFLPSGKNPEMLGEAYNLQLATKAMLFYANDKVRKQILRSRNDSLISMYSDWQVQRENLTKVYKLSIDERTTAGIDINKLEERINQTEKQLSLRSEAFSINEHAIVTWRDVQKKLKKKEAAIELIRFRKFGISHIVTDSSSADLKRYPFYELTDTVYYGALIITPNTKSPYFVLMPYGNDIEKKFIKHYKNTTRFKSSDALSYSKFWAPISEVLNKHGVRKAYFSPDGVYNGINLNTLQNQKTKKYVIDEIDICLVTNTKDLVQGKKFVNKPKMKAALFGYPEYGTDSSSFKKNILISIDTTQRFFVGGKVISLPGTEKEVKTLAELFDKKESFVSQFLGKQATEEEVKALEYPDIVHIATHGFFLSQGEVDSNRSFASFDSKKLAQNPLLRSGLLLANSQNSINGLKSTSEDGILTAYEAMNLDLDETDLVVLSACETGLGEIKNGEGVYGLQRAFQTAGAKSVLMSLWKVDDNATQELMTNFYTNWLKSGDKRKAFAQAQAAVRAKYKHPYYWGAFVLVGE